MVSYKHKTPSYINDRKDITMSFSDVLKNLRRKNNMTQEDLAEALGLTPQAISRWETGTAFPDSTVIRRLAYLFGVTTDYLLEVDPVRMKKDIGRLIFRSFDEMEPEDGAALLRDALKEYTRNESLMYALANILYHKIYLRDPSNGNAQDALHEARRLMEQLYARTGRIEHLKPLLHILRDAGMTERGNELLRSLHTSYGVREEMAIELASGEDRIRQIRKYAYDLLGKLNLYVHMLGEEESIPAEERITILTQMFEADRTLVPDDRECFYHWNASIIPYELAKLYSQSGNTDEAIRWLKVTRKACDRNYIPPIRLKSPVFRGMEQIKRNGRLGEDWMLKVMGEPCFDNIRNDPRFTEIRQELLEFLRPEWTAAILHT